MDLTKDKENDLVLTMYTDEVKWYLSNCREINITMGY